MLSLARVLKMYILLMSPDIYDHDGGRKGISAVYEESNLCEHLAG